MRISAIGTCGVGEVRALARSVRRMLSHASSRERLEFFSVILKKLANDVDGRMRKLEAAEAALPIAWSFDRSEMLAPSILDEDPPWSKAPLYACDIPGMISDEERRYYTYIGQFYAGKGEIVEIGPWLGCSTFHILAGLRPNPRFSGRKLRVYDDFVWRSAWMNDCLSTADRPRDRGNFRALFQAYIRPFADEIDVRTARVGFHEESLGEVVNTDDEDVPPLLWHGEPVEMMSSIVAVHSR